MTVQTRIITPEYLTPEIITANAGNGVVDAAPALMALDGHRVRFTSGGVYKINSTVALTRSPQWVFEEGAYLDCSAIANDVYAVTVSGSQGNSIALTVDAGIGTFSVTLTSVAGLSLNQRVRVTSVTKYDPLRLNLNIGEQHIITGISGTTVTFKEPLFNDYLVSASAVVYPLTMLDNVLFENLRLLGSEVGGKHIVGLKLQYCNQPRLHGVWAHSFGDHCFNIADCLGFDVSTAYTSLEGNTNTGYGFEVAGTTRDGTIQGHVSAGCGHAFTSGTPSSVTLAGQQSNITYRDFSIIGSALNLSNGGRDAVDTHSSAFNVRFFNGTIRGATGAGINCEIPDLWIKDVKILGATGNAIQISNTTARAGSYIIENVEVDGCSETIKIGEFAGGLVRNITVRGLRTRNFTNTIVDWSGTAGDQTSIFLSDIDADCSASTNLSGMLILSNFKHLSFSPCHIYNVPAATAAWRLNSNEDYYLNGPNFGRVSFATGGANTSGIAVQFRADSSLTIYGDPLTVDVSCTTTNTAIGIQLADANVLRTPIGEVRGNAATPISSVSGSTYRTAKAPPITLTANGTIQIPANHYIRGIYMRETAGAAVTGGIRIGTSNGGTQVVTAQAVGANAQLRVADASVSLNAWTANQTLFIQAVTSWNGASVSFVFDLQYMGLP